MLGRITSYFQVSVHSWILPIKTCFLVFSCCYLSILTDFFLFPQLRRERIAERIRALQELVPSVNKVRFFLQYIELCLTYCEHPFEKIEKKRIKHWDPFIFTVFFCGLMHTQRIQEFDRAIRISKWRTKRDLFKNNRVTWHDFPCVRLSTFLPCLLVCSKIVKNWIWFVR